FTVQDTYRGKGFQSAKIHHLPFAASRSNRQLPTTQWIVQRCSASSGSQAAFQNLPHRVAQVAPTVCRVARFAPTVWALHAVSIAGLYKHVGIRGLLAYDIAIDK